MIVPWHDPDEMLHVHDFDSQFCVYSGGTSGIGAAPREALVNPRPIGFARSEEPYIPIFWCEEG